MAKNVYSGTTKAGKPRVYRPRFDPEARKNEFRRKIIRKNPVPAVDLLGYGHGNTYHMELSCRHYVTVHQSQLDRHKQEADHPDYFVCYHCYLIARGRITKK